MSLRTLIKPWVVPILDRTPVVRAIRATRGTGARIRWGGLFAQKVLRLNGGVYWPVHFTSVIVYPKRIRVGIGTAPGLSPSCYIQGNHGIEIGDHTLVGPGVGIISTNHALDDFTRHEPSPPVRIGSNCWLSMNCVILPGTVLGDHTIVAAGAVVTSSFPEGRCVVGGVPARELRKLRDDELSFGRVETPYVGFHRLGRRNREEVLARVAPDFPG